MALLARLKDRLLGDSRTAEAIARFRDLYQNARDPEAFHAALADGDVSRAAEYHPLSEEDLQNEIDALYAAGVDLAEDYPEAADTDKEAFTEA